MIPYVISSGKEVSALAQCIGSGSARNRWGTRLDGAGRTLSGSGQPES